MIRKGRDLLSGRIEVDETYIGGQKEGGRGRGADCKTLVLVAIEGAKGKKLGRVRFRIVDTHSSYDASGSFSDDKCSVRRYGQVYGLGA